MTVKTLKTFIILLGTFTFAFSANANVMCANVFVGPAIHSHQVLDEQVRALFAANSIAAGSFYSGRKIENVLNIERLFEHPSFPIYQARVLLNNGEVVNIDFRTNGNFVFFDSSFTKIRKMKNPAIYAARIKSNGDFEFLNQSELIASTLPSIVQLSRVMAPGEIEMWRRGDIDRFFTRYGPHAHKEWYNTPGYQKPLHFAYNDYDFITPPPMRAYKMFIQLPLALLQKLIHENRAFINTYPTQAADPRYGMNHKSQTDFGLEIEIVIDGREGIRAIAPYLKEGRVDPTWSNLDKK